MRRRGRRRVMPVVALATVFCAALASGLGSVATTGRQGAIRLAAAVTPESAVTKSGSGPFSSLKVTVERTKNLVDQVVQIDWSGGAQTLPDQSFGVNYLQIMQCWGDAAAGPSPDQCEYGGRAAVDQRGGNFVTTRQLNYGGLVDPKETLPSPLPSSGLVYEPFSPVVDPTHPVDGNTNQYFDSTTTNEIPFARTRGDGHGQEYFETQTAQESSGLGCGLVVSGKPRSCWLVVVPRSDREVDDSVRDQSNSNQLQSSPLSPTNWKQRLVFPLGFAPVGVDCPIGAAERRTVGVEPIDEAFVSWQPALCANGGAVYGFSQVTDSVANRQLATNPPGMGFVTSPLPSDQVTADRPVTYAPVTLTGLTISFLIESQSGPNAPPAVKAVDGQRLSQLNLTPRLVAKLLTQSYQLGVNSAAGYLKANPPDMTRDPDFLALNPAFKNLQFHTPIADMLVPEALSKTTQLLWDWIGSDPAASDFLAGQPDPWGMRINPFYQGLVPDRQDFPKVDPFCQTFTAGLPPPGPLCTLDAHPYAADMHDAARAASRGDALARTAWDPNAIPPVYKKAPVQLNGQRAIIALADTATAARFGLTPARLENGAGQFVAPTDSTILRGLQAMTPSGVPGVLSPAPGSKLSGAYPMVSLTYAVTPQTALSQPEANDYAKLIRYAVGPGQVPGEDLGQLPSGYTPLPQNLRTQALFAAAIIQLRKGPAPTPTPSGTTPTGTGQTGTDLTGSGDTGSTDTGLGTGTTGDTSGTAGSGTTADTSGGTTPKASNALSPTKGGNVQQTIATAAGGKTPKEQASAARFVLPIALGLGGLAAAGGPALPLARRRMGR